MFDVFASVKGLLKLDEICIDNHMFRIHYKITVIILVACSLIVTSRQYFGDPIDCDVDGVPSNIMDSYCWIYSTFTVSKHVEGQIGKDVIQPGVAPYLQGEDNVRYHRYYQWVCFALFFQAMFFYFPRYVWKTWEGGRIKMLVLDLNCLILNNECKNDSKTLLINYFITYLHSQNLYAIRFFICELLNFVNVIAQLFFMDYFLEGEFWKYGIDVFEITEINPELRTDRLSQIFPKVTKCTFYIYGPSGSIQNVDGLCVLPLNIVNEKIYVFLWFWFMLVAALSAINLVYRMAVLTIPKFRMLLLKARSRLANKEDMDLVCKKCQIGDWFILYQLSRNIQPSVFKELISDLAMKLMVKENV